MGDDQLAATPIAAQPAGLFRRIASLVYDLFLLFAIAIGYGALLLLLRYIFTGDAHADTLPPVLQWPAFIGLYLALCSYYYVCWRKKGQTLGMKSWRLKLVHKDGVPPTSVDCYKRCVFGPLSLFLLGIGFLWCLLPPQHACLHDLLSNTRVLLLPKGAV